MLLVSTIVLSFLSLYKNEISIDTIFSALYFFVTLILLIGGILIAFATKNESESNKKHIGVGNIIKNLKDKIEK